jgi:hypothetical protein
MAYPESIPWFLVHPIVMTVIVILGIAAVWGAAKGVPG